MKRITNVARFLHSVAAAVKNMETPVDWIKIIQSARGRGHDLNEWRRSIDEVRFRASEPFLFGHGAEIGAGAYPQTVPRYVERQCFDIRSRDELAAHFSVDKNAVPDVYPLGELATRFPSGADFLIAHNVLEHTPNPIRTLMEWHEKVRYGGVMVVSLPDASLCPDNGRPVASLEHVVMDYLLRREEVAFESREHVYSFMVGWNDVGATEGKTKQEFARLAHERANADSNDFHWHAFDRVLTEKVILAAALFGGRSVAVERVADSTTDDCRTSGDIIYIYRLLEANSGPATHQMPGFLDELTTIRERLATAAGHLAAAMGATDGPAP